MERTSIQVWTCNKFSGHYPVGTSAIVMADNAENALTCLVAELRKHGLSGTNLGKPLTTDDLELLPITDCNKAIILQDGNY